MMEEMGLGKRTGGNAVIFGSDFGTSGNPKQNGSVYFCSVAHQQLRGGIFKMCRPLSDVTGLATAVEDENWIGPKPRPVAEWAVTAVLHISNGSSSA